MPKMDSTGVYQLKNGNWGYRFCVSVNGKSISKRCSRDAFGRILRTKKEAIQARMQAIVAEHTETPVIEVAKAELAPRTVKEVFLEYCEKGRSGKAYQTIRKQDSLWEIHLRKKFGKRFVDDISVAEVEDYLTNLYYKQKYSYRYTESFLKMFYLIFGQAYSRNYLDVDIYNKLCVNKDTKIKMPKLKVDDDTDIAYFTQEELALLDEYFDGTNAQTAYMLGRYCGLRINECFGLKWSNVDLENGTILIDRQMQYQESLIKLVPLKTKNARRTIYMCDTLKNYFIALSQKREKDAEQYAELRVQKRRIIQDLDGSNIYSTDMVNCLPNGTLQTVNSFKYPSRDINQKLGIQFKYHYLRHTYGTMMAELNTPTHLLCNQMGHGKIQVTQQYYLAVSKYGIQILQRNLNRL